MANKLQFDSAAGLEEPLLKKWMYLQNNKDIQEIKSKAFKCYNIIDHIYILYIHDSKIQSMFSYNSDDKPHILSIRMKVQ